MDSESPDDFVLKMFSTANFGPNARVVLPSGKELKGDEMSVLTSYFKTELEKNDDRKEKPDWFSAPRQAGREMIKDRHSQKWIIKFSFPGAHCYARILNWGNLPAFTPYRTVAMTFKNKRSAKRFLRKMYNRGDRRHAKVIEYE